MFIPLLRLLIRAMPRKILAMLHKIFFLQSIQEKEEVFSSEMK